MFVHSYNPYVMVQVGITVFDDGGDWKTLPTGFNADAEGRQTVQLCYTDSTVGNLLRLFDQFVCWVIHFIFYKLRRSIFKPAVVEVLF